MLLWGAGAAWADDGAGAETFVSIRVNGPRGNVLLQDEMPLPVDRILVAPDGKHSLGVYVKPTEDGRAIVELVAGKEKDGRPLPKVQQSFELQHFAPHLEDLLYKKSKWSVEAILGQSWDPPPVTEAASEPVRYVLAWDDAKLMKAAPEIEVAPAEGAAPAPAPKPKPKPRPKPGQPPVEDVVVARARDGGRTDVAAQASPMKVLGPHGTKFVHAETVLVPDPAWHCAMGGAPTDTAAVQPFYVGLGDLVPRMTSREVVGQFDDATGYRVAAGVALTPEGEGTGKFRVSTGGLSFVIAATEDDVAFYYRPSTHFAPVAERPMSLAAGTVGTTQLGEVTWSGEGALPVQGMRGIAAPLATVRVPCAEVRLRPDLAKLQP